MKQIRTNSSAGARPPCRTARIKLCTAVLCLACVAPAFADISAVVPPEGTIGTGFTITGSGFGQKRGKVQLGEERCKILSWSDTQITCEVVIAQPAGDYTVALSPQGSMKKSVPQTYSPFVMRPPYINLGEPMRLVTPLSSPKKSPVIVTTSIHASNPDDYPNNPSGADWARLATYAREQTDTAWFSNPIYWNRYAEKHLKWIESGESNKEIGFEVQYKIGVQVGEYFGMGTEGSFGVKTTTKVTVENHSELSLVPGPSNGAPFESFRIDAYWLEPNADGYWVPLNRRGTGDAPWFITYRVSDPTPPWP